MPKFTVFYGTQLFGEYDKLPSFIDVGEEVYNSAYVYMKGKQISGWYRLDNTPVLIEDVPKELRAFILILNL